MQEKSLVEGSASLFERFDALPGNDEVMALEVENVYYREVSAAIRPPGSPPPPAVPVPRGYGIYIQRSYNNGWTDNRDAGTRPLEGFSFEENNEYIPAARRAQLVTKCDSKWYIGYDKKIDRSQGGTYYIANDTAGDWNLHWYMNDSMNANNSGYPFYHDNAGTANIDFVVFRL